jgi:hypothetical protein
VIPVIKGGNWHHLKIIPTVPQEHTWAPRSQETTENIMGTAYTRRIILTQQQKSFITVNNITRTKNCNHRIAATLHILAKWFGSGI